MEHLSCLIDPRFVRPLAIALGSGPHTELDLRDKFTRGVPNRKMSQRSLSALLELAGRGGLIACDRGAWRIVGGRDVERAVRDCLESWSAPGFTGDSIFRNRCAASLDRGMLSAQAGYTPMIDLASRPSLTAAEWARIISGPVDLRQLTGRASRHADADFLMLYRSCETVPITDDRDVAPRVARSALPDLPSDPEDLLSGIRAARDGWWRQVGAPPAGVSMGDLSGFIVYAKEMLDLLFWGAPSPLRSLASAEHLELVSQRVQRFGIRAEDLSTVWRWLPSVYRAISRLSWGVRYLSNNLSHPEPPEPSAGAFSRVCRLPQEAQSAVSASRSGHSLNSITRPLALLHRALEGWGGRAGAAATARECAAAVGADMDEDGLLRRELAQRIKRLNVVGAIHVLDALARGVPAPDCPEHADGALASAGLIAAFSMFCESAQGRAYAEVRLALHAELDFQRRFNIHELSAPRRYLGIWRGTLLELVARLEGARRGCARGPEGPPAPPGII
jgi:hypothetical protein